MTVLCLKRRMQCLVRLVLRFVAFNLQLSLHSLTYLTVGFWVLISLKKLYTFFWWWCVFSLNKCLLSFWQYFRESNNVLILNWLHFPSLMLPNFKQNSAKFLKIDFKIEPIFNSAHWMFKKRTQKSDRRRRILTLFYLWRFPGNQDMMPQVVIKPHGLGFDLGVKLAYSQFDCQSHATIL